MMSSVIVSLCSVFVGWLLSQFSAPLNDFIKCRRVKQCLIEELDEINDHVDRTLLIYTRNLQIIALNGISTTTPITITANIFKHHYKDAVLGLNKAQRQSYQLIYSQVEAINDGIKELNGIIDKHDINSSTTEPEVKILHEKIQQKIIAEFHNAAIAKWHIEFHLNNTDNPMMDLHSDIHKNYIEYNKSIDENCIKIIHDAKKDLDRSQFIEKIGIYWI
ncbi:Uncharacterised protein [Plesiomonas shigelloides]|nr:hypothetical protein GBN18_00235 [Plesiomonas shigelloides]SPZ37420.1 Uncharacterised protein [Plesiomonas shigelloides]